MFKQENTKEKVKEDKLKDIISAVSVFEHELGIVSLQTCFSRQGGGLINEQIPATVRALNYSDPSVFQKQGSNREENSGSNAS